jgi:hypothetical protein
MEYTAMRSLSDLLLNYHVPGIKSAEIRRICADEVEKLTGCKLTSNQISYKNEKLVLSVPPVLKSAILLRKDELMNRIKARDVELYAIK